MSFQAQYDEYQQTLQALHDNAISVDSQLYEHEIVADTLKGVPADRKAWRLISNGDSGVIVGGKGKEDQAVSSSGALVETNAGDAHAKLLETIKGLQQLKEKLEKETVEVRKEFDDWKVKNNVKIVRSG